ncbi:MAG: Flp/Fap pilin component [Candidatus Eremiobacteraeota bacterium]|nr:Flp/Fap pilin component [Candidatus Eremiobacteraeota bacterium]
MNAFLALLRDDEGATLYEYCLILALVAVVAITGLNTMSGVISSSLVNMAQALTKGQTGP